MTHSDFTNTVWGYYKENRRVLPWRPPSLNSSNNWGQKHSYEILVSEIMLQQTQVDRVTPLYANFISRFPNWKTLAKASLVDALRAWKGLGYNRRAKFLHECAKEVEVRGGQLPKRYRELLELPGVGAYTAGMLMNTVWNVPHPIIETNIRTVYLYHFFKNKEKVTDKEILEKITKTIDKDRPREWQYALMDYGSHLKKRFGNNNAAQSAHHKKQSAFRGSARELRSAILHELTNANLTKAELIKKNTKHAHISSIDSILDSLVKEKLIIERNNCFMIA